jgi:hypothetical protein
MSLRPEVSGFRLDALRGVLGCGDPATADGAAAHAARLVPGGIGALVAQIAHGLVLGGPGPDIEDENVVLAVIALALFEQEHLRTDSSVWGSWFRDWARGDWKSVAGGAALPADPDRAGELITYALVERPLVGRRQFSHWTTYGYLTHAEVGELLHHAELAPGLTADPSGFARDFFGRLRTIHDAGLDYWFYGA